MKTQNKSILIVDDEEDILKVTSAILEDEGYRTYTANNGAMALSLMKEKDIDLVLSDLKMPEINGMDLFKQMRAINPGVAFIIMTAYGSIESAVAAMKDGALNYLIKPLNYEELFIIIERAMREQALSQQVDAYRMAEKERNAAVGFIGNHPSIRHVLEKVRMVAPTSAPVLIWGETGTGKELIAQSLHGLSQFSANPMICINSAALNENLLESEMFGYVKGAFTNATSNKKGRLEMAHEGTLFLDEISRMSLPLQAKLLRFLQEGTFEPVGSTESRRVQVRVIAATNRDLYEEMEKQRFLSDLFYRLDVFSLHLPPLRQRGDDILLLASYFIQKFSTRYEKKIEGLTDAALNLIRNYHWPGNVRQLKNHIERSVIMCKESRIDVVDLPERIALIGAKKNAVTMGENIASMSLSPPEENLRLKDVEIALIKKALQHCKGNKSAAANLLGINRKSLYERIERYHILY